MTGSPMRALLKPCQQGSNISCRPVPESQSGRADRGSNVFRIALGSSSKPDSETLGSPEVW